MPACLYSMLRKSLDNYSEFELELLRLAQSSSLRTSGNLQDSMRDRLELDRRLANLLTSCRLYLDQTDHGISGLYGNTSTQLSEIKSYKNQLYDNHEGYQIMEALRNHVQHSGLLVHTISYNMARSKTPGSKYNAHTVIPKASVRTLAENKQFKKSVMKKLQKGDDSLDLRKPAREYISCFLELHDKLREIVSDLVNQSRTLYESAVSEFSVVNGEAVEFPMLSEYGEDGAAIEEVALVTEFLEYYDDLKRKNQINKRLRYSFASNSDE